MRDQVTLIFTNSLDATADLVISRLGSEAVFRFNFDLWRDYVVEITPDDFAIEDPVGRRLTTTNLAKVYCRKPLPTVDLYPEREIPREQRYAEAELWVAFLDLVSWWRRERKLVLVEPAADDRVGRMVQARLARDLFEVPSWQFTRGKPPATAMASVVKSLTGSRVAHHSVLFTTRVNPVELDPAYPWFVQEYAPAATDVTVVYVRGDLFAFELPREGFLGHTPDWRLVAREPGAPAWRACKLPPAIAAGACTLMDRLELDYGRFDFLRDEAGKYVFLEVNPNGEWGWLDMEGRHGLLDRMLAEIDPDTPRNPLRT